MSALPERPKEAGAMQHGHPTSPDTNPAPTAASAADEAHVLDIVRSSGTSFYGAMRTLPKDRRDAMFAIYAFCREIDDIADDPLPPDSKAAALTKWREEIDRLYGGSPQSPIGRALLKPVGRYDLRRQDFLALIDGMEMDAKEDFKGPSMDTLTLYCERVAGAVGMLSVRIFGEPGAAGERLAWSLGQALQLTNILRDVREDCDRGRLYLPDELLRKHGIETREPALVLEQPTIPLVCADLAELARQRFSEARAAMRDCDRRKIRPAVAMMHVYRAILDKLIERGWNRLDEPVKVSKAKKIWIALRYGLL
ncbi:MAG: presqualene diphosphate synthase HpnD [Pseudomonadota bacterium]